MYMDTKITANPVQLLELSEIIEKLRKNGYSEVVECLLDNEAECYTKKGRLNKSATTRKLKWKNKQLEDALENMRELLKNEFQLEES
jgi:hypothetical protein